MSEKEGNLSIPQHEKEMVARYKFTYSEWLRWRMSGELPPRVKAANEVRFKDQMAGLNSDKQKKDDFERKSPPVSLEKERPKTEAEFRSWSLSLIDEIKATLFSEDLSLDVLRQTLTLIEYLDGVRMDFINLHYGQNEWQVSFIGKVRQISERVRQMVTASESIQYQFVAFRIFTYLEEWGNLTKFNDRQQSREMMVQKIQNEQWNLIAMVLTSKTNFSYLLPKILLKELRSHFDQQTGLQDFDYDLYPASMLRGTNQNGVLRGFPLSGASGFNTP